MAIDNIVAGSLGLPPINDAIKDVPAVKEIVAESNPNKSQYDQSTITFTGNTANDNVNIYRGINPNNMIIDQHETIGGSDMSVYILLDTPMSSDLDLPKESQRKDFITLELENAISLSYSTIRERFPIRAIGHSNSKAYTKGPRTISGHLAFNVFTRDVLQYLRSRVAKEFQIINDNIANRDVSSEQLDKITSEFSIYRNNLLKDKVQLLDDLPPFHILCMGTNENGIFSKLLIKGVCIIDENQYQGTQQPNIINKVTWVAQDIIPMNELEKWNSTTTVATSITSYEESMTSGIYNGKANLNYDITGNQIVNDLMKDINGV